MSKLIHQLKQAMEIKQNKYTLALNRQAASATLLEEQEPENQSLIFNESGKNEKVMRISAWKFNLITGLIVFLICSGSLTSLYILKVLAKIQGEKRASSSELAYLIKNQDEKIGLLESSVQQINQQKQEQLNKLNSETGALKKRLMNTKKELSELSIENNILRVMVNDVKSTNEHLTDKLLDFSEELEKMKL